jgi:hypothetical protein
MIQKYKVPTKKEFRNDPKNNGASWDDLYGRFSCEGCGRFFQPGEMVHYTGYRKGYHKQCVPGGSA